jgi:UDP-N-acetylglucosamine acyltransferase
MTNPKIHSTAIVAAGAKLGADVEIGPYAVIEDEVEIGSGTIIGPHAVVHRHTRIGTRNRIHAHAILGDTPQHLAYKPEDVTWLEIGDDNVFRETVTVHRAFHAGGATRIGSHCFLMASSHVGHDSIIGNHVIITNGTLLGGHVTVGDRAVLGGNTGVHQFVRIGPFAMTAAGIMIRKDVLPYSMLAGEPARHYRLNGIGLRRNGINGERYKALERAFRQLRAGEGLEGIQQTEELRFLSEWLEQPSKRGLSGFVQSQKPEAGNQDSE